MAADRAAVECPEHLGLRRRPTIKVEKMVIRQQPSTRQAGSSAVLGRMPWDKPGDCIQARRAIICGMKGQTSSNPGNLGLHKRVIRLFHI